jgi:predicted  nucleic acid-binding Zn-ribbon protein
MTWGYQERKDVIRDARKAAAGADATQKELKALRDEVRVLRDSQRKLLDAFTELTREMQKMREEMYPPTKTSKPVLKRPPAPPKPR